MEKELIQKYELLTNILYINMWGEAQRHDNNIFIMDVEDNIESKLCIKIAVTVAQMHKVTIVLDCSFWQYLHILKEYKSLFRNKLFVHARDHMAGRPVDEWLYDISDAQGAPREIWKEVWEYING